MKRVGYLYEKMCDLALIKLAIHKAAQGKTRKHYIAKVLANEEKYALRIQKMLLDNEVRLSPNRTIEIYDRSCMKQRLITVPKFFPDQILHWVLMLVIEPILMKGMYRFACGSVPGRGGMEAKKYVERALRDDKVRYVAKLHTFASDELIFFIFGSAILSILMFYNTKLRLLPTRYTLQKAKYMFYNIFIDLHQSRDKKRAD